jgi:cysteine desulfuration protein SufE
LNSINHIQDEIIEEFSMLQGDLDMCVEYLIELGRKISPLPDQYKIEDHIVKGCQSKVWLVASQENGQVNFLADSNTMITKGLVSMLIRVFSGQSANDILNADLYFVQKIGMNRFIGTQRSNGLAAMIKQMKLYALAFMAREKKESS